MTREDYDRLIEKAKKAERDRYCIMQRADAKVEEAWRDAANGLAKLMEKKYGFR